MKYKSRSHVKCLRPLLLLAGFAALTSPTFAQVRTDCVPTLTTSSGSRLNFYLNATANPDLSCRTLSDVPFVPGTVVPGCYSGTETTLDGHEYTLNSLTTCTVCAEGQAGCYVYLPPPRPPVVPTYPVPPIHAYYDPDAPWDPHDPWNPWHPWDPSDLWWPSCLSPYVPEWPYR